MGLDPDFDVNAYEDEAWSTVGAIIVTVVIVAAFILLLGFLSASVGEVPFFSSFARRAILLIGS